MAITAAQREELRELARGALGERGADLLMAGLDAADLAGLEERLTLRIELVRAEHARRTQACDERVLARRGSRREQR